MHHDIVVNQVLGSSEWFFLDTYDFKLIYGKTAVEAMDMTGSYII
jgi:hypothetical protein